MRKQFSIFNFQFSKGFTLIELLVSIGLFTVVTTIIISVLFNSLRANRKSEVIVGVKQIGNTVMSQMVNGIRYSRSLDDPLDCVTPVTQSSIIVTGLDYGQTQYSCPGSDSDTISSNSATLVDPNSVVIKGCSFTCSQSALEDPPTITIQYILGPASTTDAAETSGDVQFQTSVTLRNYSR